MVSIQQWLVRPQVAKYSYINHTKLKLSLKLQDRLSKKSKIFARKLLLKLEILEHQ